MGGGWVNLWLQQLVSEKPQIAEAGRRPSHICLMAGGHSREGRGGLDAYSPATSGLLPSLCSLICSHSCSVTQALFQSLRGTQL